MRARAACLVLAFTLAFPTLGCGGSSDCACSGGGYLFVELATPVPGGRVRVCFDDACAAGEITAADGTADEAEVPEADLGAWPQQRDSELELTVIDRDGGEVRTTTATPVEHSNCCGPYWILSE